MISSIGSDNGLFKLKTWREIEEGDKVVTSTDPDSVRNLLLSFVRNGPGISAIRSLVAREGTTTSLFRTPDRQIISLLVSLVLRGKIKIVRSHAPASVAVSLTNSSRNAQPEMSIASFYEERPWVADYNSDFAYEKIAQWQNPDTNREAPWKNLPGKSGDVQVCSLDFFNDYGQNICHPDPIMERKIPVEDYRACLGADDSVLSQTTHVPAQYAVLAKLYEARGGKMRYGEGEINVIGVRGLDNRGPLKGKVGTEEFSRYNDTIFVLVTEGGEPKVYDYYASTQPGVVTGGRGILAKGLFDYQIGGHLLSSAAYKQYNVGREIGGGSSSFRTFEENKDTDGLLTDENIWDDLGLTGKDRTEENLAQKITSSRDGYNIHAGGVGEHSSVGEWSRGCQVMPTRYALHDDTSAYSDGHLEHYFEHFKRKLNFSVEEGEGQEKTIRKVNKDFQYALTDVRDLVNVINGDEISESHWTPPRAVDFWTKADNSPVRSDDNFDAQFKIQSQADCTLESVALALEKREENNGDSFTYVKDLAKIDNFSVRQGEKSPPSPPGHPADQPYTGIHGEAGHLDPGEYRVVCKYKMHGSWIEVDSRQFTVLESVDSDP